MISHKLQMLLYLNFIQLLNINILGLIPLVGYLGIVFDQGIPLFDY